MDLDAPMYVEVDTRSNNPGRSISASDGASSSVESQQNAGIDEPVVVSESTSLSTTARSQATVGKLNPIHMSQELIQFFNLRTLCRSARDVQLNRPKPSRSFVSGLCQAGHRTKKTVQLSLATRVNADCHGSRWLSFL